MSDRKPCIICGRVHAAPSFCASGLAANSNFVPVAKSAPRKRLSAQEAMKLTKARYGKTLAYLA